MKKILLVEDSPDAILLCRFALADIDCHIDIATTIETALAKLSETEYALVLLDLSLPPTSTYQQTVERIPEFARCAPVFVITAMPDLTLPSACRLQGATDFAHKIDLAENPRWFIDRVKMYIDDP